MLTSIVVYSISIFPKIPKEYIDFSPAHLKFLKKLTSIPLFDLLLLDRITFLQLDKENSGKIIVEFLPTDLKIASDHIFCKLLML